MHRPDLLPVGPELRRGPHVDALGHRAGHLRQQPARADGPLPAGPVEPAPRGRDAVGRRRVRPGARRPGAAGQLHAGTGRPGGDAEDGGLPVGAPVPARQGARVPRPAVRAGGLRHRREPGRLPGQHGGQLRAHRGAEPVLGAAGRVAGGVQPAAEGAGAGPDPADLPVQQPGGHHQRAVRSLRSAAGLPGLADARLRQRLRPERLRLPAGRGHRRGRHRLPEPGGEPAGGAPGGRARRLGARAAPGVGGPAAGPTGRGTAPARGGAAAPEAPEPPLPAGERTVETPVPPEQPSGPDHEDLAARAGRGRGGGSRRRQSGRRRGPGRRRGSEEGPAGRPSGGRSSRPRRRRPQGAAGPRPAQLQHGPALKETASGQGHHGRQPAEPPEGAGGEEEVRDLPGLHQDGGAAALQTPVSVPRLHQHRAAPAAIPAELPAVPTHDPQHHGRVPLKVDNYSTISESGTAASRTASVGSSQCCTEL